MLLLYLSLALCANMAYPGAIQALPGAYPMPAFPALQMPAFQMQAPQQIPFPIPVPQPVPVPQPYPVLYTQVVALSITQAVTQPFSAPTTPMLTLYQPFFLSNKPTTVVENVTLENQKDQTTSQLCCHCCATTANGNGSGNNGPMVTLPLSMVQGLQIVDQNQISVTLNGQKGYEKGLYDGLNHMAQDSGYGVDYYDEYDMPHYYGVNHIYGNDDSYGSLSGYSRGSLNGHSHRSLGGRSRDSLHRHAHPHGHSPNEPFRLERICNPGVPMNDMYLQHVRLAQ